MSENKSRFVHLCQQLLALGTVAALAAPAAGVVSLDIVGPSPAPDGAAAGPAPSPVAMVASEPVAPEVTEVPIEGVDRAGLSVLDRVPTVRRGTPGALAGLTAPEKVDGFATVGVTWDGDVHLDEDEISVSVRSLKDGAWSSWEPVEYHDEHGPTPGSREAVGARQGTEPVVVGYVDEVQVRIETADGEVPAGASLAVIDPQETASRVAAPAIDTVSPPQGGALTLSTAGTDTPGPTPRPQIFSRAQWGADEGLRRKSALTYHEVHAGFVHHTVNANDYSRDQVPSILRGIYAYHTRTRGWSDIGYNFVVDRFGRIWEGRFGGVDRPVVGAHTMGYNEYSFAMSALGNFETAKPSSAMLDAYGRLFAWKLSLHGISASSTQQWVGRKLFPAVNGHRDAGSTACPGKHLYAQLGRIRTLAEGYQAPFTSRSRMADLGGSPWPDLVVRDAATKRLHVVRTGGQTNFSDPQVAATGWKGMDLVAVTPDVTGDDVPDVLGRNRATKVLGVYPGTSQGTLGSPVLETARFSRVDLLVGVGDLTGDGRGDLVGRDAGSTQLWVYPGRGNGGFRQRQLLSDAWGGYDLTAGVGDLDGDGRNDLVARAGSRLHLVKGTAHGLGKPVVLPGSWASYSRIAGGGDLTNDGRPDLVAQVRTNKRVFVFPGLGNGRFGHRLGPFTQLKSVDLAGAASLAGDHGADLVGRDGQGRLLVLPNNGSTNLEAVVDTGLTYPGANLVLNVGDWNGDGYGDIMVRTAKGVMQLRPGDSRGGFGRAVRAATDWNKVRLVAAVGDITGDGHPDLMGQPAGMSMRIYPGDGATGFGADYVAHSAISSDRHTGLGLWDTDGSPDSLLRHGDGSLMLYRGNGPGGLLRPTQIGAGAKRYDWLQAVGDATGDGRPDLVARESATGKLWLLPGTSTGFGVRRLVAEGFGGYDLSG
jgi:hypothetical protein